MNPRLSDDTKNTSCNIRDLIKDFKYVVFTFLTIAVSGLIITLLETPYPFITSLLYESRSTPWGIITSIFVHASLFHHFLINIAVLLSMCFSFVCGNFELKSEEKRYRSYVFLVVTFLAAVVANTIYFLILYFFNAPSSALGSSGAVSASIAVVLHFSGKNIRVNIDRLLNIIILIFSVFLFAIAIFSAQANTVIHLLSFLSALFLTEVIERYSTKSHFLQR